MTVSRIWYILTRIIPASIRQEPPFTISELEDIYPAASAQIQGRCGIP